MLQQNAQIALEDNVKFPDNRSKKNGVIHTSKDEPCRHCGKPDWCYRIPNSPLEVCKRPGLWVSGEPAKGYFKTSKMDNDGANSAYFLAPISQQKQPRPKQRREWYYENKSGEIVVKVVRVDDGNGEKKIWQEHYQNGRWVAGLGDIKREDISVYQSREVMLAQLTNSSLFIVEGESCADKLRELKLLATTNIGGSGKWTDSDSSDVKGAQLIVCPDRDKPGVKHFLEIYKRHPDAKVLLPYPDSPLWDNLPDSGGLDVADWIEEYHVSKDDILGQAMNITPELIERLERQFDSIDSLDVTDIKAPVSSSNRAGKIPKADKIAVEIAEDYQDKLAYNNENGCWMFYGLENPGVWQVITNEIAESIISKELDSRGVTGYGSHNYVLNILKKIRCILVQRVWDEASSSDYLPFQDKVLELKTGKVIEHSPGFRFTWSLPRNYDENANDWTLIQSWLDEVTGGKQELKDIITCFCNAVLKGRYELQKVLFTTGQGGTGKTTLQNLIVELIGIRNTNITSLSEFCGNRFETANAYGKRLTIFPDEDKYSGNLQRFKDLTGGGWLKVERKGKDVERKYKYTGMVMMASNFPVFVGEQSSAIKRRIITVPFTQSPGKVDTNLFEKLASQLNGFTNYLLSLSDEFITRTLSDTQECGEVAFMEWEQRMMTDSVAWWLNEFTIRDENAATQIGNDKNEAKDKRIEDVITLYGSYYQRCLDAGKTPKANTEFSRHLLDLCRNILGWKEVFKDKTNRNNKIVGLRLRRKEIDDHIPTLEEKYSEELGDLSSTSSTIETQQGFEPSTTSSTMPSTTSSTMPSTTSSTAVSRDEFTIESPRFKKVEDTVENKVENKVEDSKPCHIRKVEDVEDEGHIFNEIFIEGERFSAGDTVSYVGERYADTLSGLKLEIAEYKDEQYNCIKPDGRYTTWLYPEELSIIKLEDHESTD